MEAPRLELQLYQQQERALTAPAEEILYGGAAGGGKSHLMRAAATIYCTSVPGLNAYFFRRFFPDLVKNHMEGPGSFHMLLAPLVNSGHVEIVQKEIRFWNGSRIFLNHMNHEKDLPRFQGSEIHALFMDELTHFTESMYRYLRGRMRLGGLKIPDHLAGKFPRMMAGTNPGGVGHVWVKRTFVKAGAYHIKRSSDEEGGMRRVFVPARAVDNPSLLANDPRYLQRLEGLGDPVLVKAMRDGDWNIVAGAVYGYVWRQERHVCRPFRIPRGWKIWRGADDGFAAPAAVYWFTQNPNTKTVYVVAELYEAKMLPETMAAKIKRIDSRIIMGDGKPYGEPIKGILDSAAFADTGQQNAIPRGKVMNAHGCRFKPCEKWPGSRVDRVKHLHRLLAKNPLCPKGGPGLVFFDTCENAIETIPALPRDPHDIEDVDTDAEDHPFDAVTYGLMWKQPLHKKTDIGGI